MTLPSVPRTPKRPFNARNVTRSRWFIFAGIAGAAIFLVAITGGRGSSSLRSKSQSSAGAAADIKSSNNAAPAAAPVPILYLRSGLKMPAVGYGTCCRKSAKGEAIYHSTRIYLKNGGRLIDTAMAYGNHREIGQAVADSGIDRSEIWITSKIAPGKVKSYDACLSAVDGILKELGTTYIDLLLIHSQKLGKELTIELWRGLIETKRLGKVKAIGVSNFNRGEIEDIAMASGEWPEANEIQQHPWSSKAWKDLTQWHKEKGIATIAYTSLGGSRFHRSEGGTIWPDTLTKIAQKHSATEAQVLLKWALKKDIAVIPGSGSKKHIKENLLLPLFDLSDSEASDIEGTDAPEAWWDPERGPNKNNDEEALKAWAKRKYG